MPVLRFPICVAATLMLLFMAPVQAANLLFASWGGAHNTVQRLALVDPFQRQTGIGVELLQHNGSLQPLRAGAVWDGISLLREQAEQGCSDGLLRPLDPERLRAAPDGTPATEDFLPGLLLPCAVGEAIWSYLPAFDAGAFEATAPSRIADLFDPDRFPGQRALYRHPRGLLEWALLADGVPPASVYTVLATDSGLDRAFAQLDRIRGSIRWWSSLDEPRQLLEAGEVSMAAVFSDRFLQEQVDSAAPFPLLWDGHLWQATYWAIPVNAQHPEQAERFILHASSTRALAERARYSTQGPARSSAVRAHHLPYQDLLPSWPENFARGLRWDLSWWREHGEAARQRFRQWLDTPAERLSASTPKVAPAAVEADVPRADAALIDGPGVDGPGIDGPQDRQEPPIPALNLPPKPR